MCLMVILMFKVLMISGRPRYRIRVGAVIDKIQNFLLFIIRLGARPLFRIMARNLSIS